ncbi:MAG: tRNA (pseudouridine(54)-N(1))-methyltransferase TrmY [Nanoarchaeota archaeon]
MREFILRALKAHTSSFNVDNLEDAGKMHIVSRCISNALWVVKGLREDTIMHVVLEGPKFPPKLISFYGSKLKGFAFDELGISKFIKYALEKGENLKLNESLEVFPGIIISKKSFEQFVREKSPSSQIIYMHKKGKNIREFKFKENILFVFGDYIGMPRKTEFYLERFNAEKVSLGKIEYHASQCITIVQNELDRKVYI